MGIDRGGLKGQVETWCKGNSCESTSTNPAKTPSNDGQGA